MLIRPKSGREPSGCIKGGEVLDEMGYYQLLECYFMQLISLDGSPLPSLRLFLALI
jgi:hypothetical protein